MDGILQHGPRGDSKDGCIQGIKDELGVSPESLSLGAHPERGVGHTT